MVINRVWAATGPDSVMSNWKKTNADTTTSMHMYKPFGFISYNNGARNLVLENQEC